MHDAPYILSVLKYKLHCMHCIVIPVRAFAVAASHHRDVYRQAYHGGPAEFAQLVRRVYASGAPAWSQRLVWR